MPTISTINGTSADDINRWDGVSRVVIDKVNTIDWPEVPLVVPAGLIVLYPGGAGGAPSGWTMFTAANGYYVIGAGDTYIEGDSGAGGGEVTKATSTTADHTGSAINFQATAGNAGATAAGGHAHNFSFTYAPPGQQCYLIQCDAGATQLPANSAILSQDGDPSGGSLANIYTDGYMFKANNAVTTVGSNSISGLTSTSAGGHRHGTIRGGSACVGGSNCAATASVDAHTHATVTVSMTNTLRQFALSAWRNAAADYDLVANMIGMWEDLANLPSGWYACDGTNGTPDLQNYFIKLVAGGAEGASGDGTVTAAVASIAHSSHTHLTASNCGNISGKNCVSANYAVYHHTLTGAAHSMSQNYTWLPPYYALGFIMYGG